ncbi:hypothetical protein GCM10010411_17290 [Actinomadura fulvescens]|uniref:Uncharacterized protein n=1 Tax=Actinomadura fulvescens TaxID=46160 RepID=A0ABP6BT54_9ACTN
MPVIPEDRQAERTHIPDTRDLSFASLVHDGRTREVIRRIVGDGPGDGERSVYPLPRGFNSY